MGARRQNFRRLVRPLRTQDSILLPDADEKRRRAHVHLLSLRKLQVSVERKLERDVQRLSYEIPGMLLRTAIFLFIVASICTRSLAVDGVSAMGGGTISKLSELPTAAKDQRFHFVVFTCIYGRPDLTDFVLSHYASIRRGLAEQQQIDLDIFLTGSSAEETEAHAKKVGAAFAIFPNSPLGAKHNAGLAAMRQMYAGSARTPDAVVVIGSDDLLNAGYFVMTRSRLLDAPHLEVLGVRDLYLYDLATGRLVYTKGYRRFATPLAGTIGCGRVFKWALLERMEWVLWDGERDRSLDQSTVRRVSAALGDEVSELSEAVMGNEAGAVALDVKTGGMPGGRNIWSFNDIISAVGPKGTLHRFRDVDPTPFFDAVFALGFEADQLAPLRIRMAVEGGEEDSEGDSGRTPGELNHSCAAADADGPSCPA